MHVWFGNGLDGRSWLPTVTEADAVLGRVVVGPMGFLRLLESAVGTVGPEVRDIQRMLNYLRALQATNSPTRFYHASLSTDPLAVARHLLSIRDELKTSGWSGKDVAGVARMSDFAAIEAIAKEIDGMPDRLERMTKRLEAYQSLPFEKLYLVDPPGHFPKSWRRVFEILATKKVSVEPFKIELAKADADLGSAKRLLAGEKSEPAKGDGSFRILMAQDPWQAARWTAAWLAASGSEFEKTVFVVPERYQRILAAAFHERGISFGDDNRSPSVARPSVQVLVLALALAWAPKSPRMALSLLLLPSSPIPRAVAFRLADALAEAPAIGSDEWNTAIERGLESLKTKEDGEARAARAQARVDDFFHATAIKTSDGILPKEISAICERVAKWARGLGEIQGLSSYQEAALLAEAMGAAARDCGLDKLSPESVSRLLADVIGSGVSAQNMPARFGGPIIVSDPASILAPVEHVVWWDFSQGTSANASKAFWSKQQRDVLSKHGIDIQDSISLAVQNSSRWPRAIAGATKTFLGVCFEADNSREAESLHPLADQILPAKSAERKQWIAAVTVRPGLSEDGATKKFEGEAKATVAEAVIPAWRSRHDWNVNPGMVKLREHESPSALEKMLGCLFAYTLHYGAKLREGQLEQLSDGNLLSGKIAHKVFQEVFGPGRHPQPEEARKAASQAIETILPTYAATLLESEQRWFVAQMSSTIVSAAGEYAEFLKSNKLEILRVETEKRDSLLGPTNLVGTPDHVLGSGGKPELIMDHKWGGGKYKYNDLKEGTSLQLSMYSYLERTGASFPGVGYYILEDQQVLLLGLNKDRARTVDGPSAKDVFDASLSEIKKRAALLEQGKISADGVHENQANAVWKAGCKFCGFGVICGKHWEEN